MEELPNFGHISTSTILFESRDKILVTTWTEIMMSYSLFQNTFILRKLLSCSRHFGTAR